MQVSVRRDHQASNLRRCHLLLALCLALALLGVSACTYLASSDSGTTGADRSFDQSSVVVERGHFRHILRLSGTVSALQSYNVQAPRLFGQTSSTMVITKIVQNGTQVQAGDVLVEFDSQSQMKNILDKQAEHDNLIQQIRKKQADHDSALAVDETEIKAAEVDVQTARVEMRKNEVIPGYQAEINKVNLAEAQARLKQLKATFDLKREAQAAELRILEIQRDRAKAAADHAHRNIENMTIRSPMSGLVVLTPSYRGSIMVDPQEGDEVRPGGGIMMVVNPFQMEVLARANQVDISQIYVGQPAKISLDAYPDLVFPGKIKSIGAIGIPSNYIKRIRYFSVVVSIQGSNPKLLPDLTAAVDLELADEQDVLMVPREAVAILDQGAFVELLENGSPSLKSIEIGLMNECEAVIESGLEEGMIVSLNPEIPTGTDDSLQDQTKGPR